jgi:hypothetical protein
MRDRDVREEVHAAESPGESLPHRPGVFDNAAEDQHAAQRRLLAQGILWTVHENHSYGIAPVARNMSALNGDHFV